MSLYFTPLPLPWLILTVCKFASASAGNSSARLSGSLLPKINADTWQGWEPPEGFGSVYRSWPDKKVPQDIEMWCKGFIPQNATEQYINGTPVMAIKGPGGLPIPGLLGMCAGIDGRSWSTQSPDSSRPTDSRFWGWLEVSRGRGASVQAGAICGVSHNICCETSGCWGGYKYGEVTCSQPCPDEEMQIKRQACWTLEGTVNGTQWSPQGQTCDGAEILAAKVYVRGRGGNPCGKVLSVKPPPASWDVGMVAFPSKRRVTITGFVDDAPSYECYARAKDGNMWGPTVTLVQMPMDMKSNIALELAGYSERAVNPNSLFFDLPEADSKDDVIVI